MTSGRDLLRLAARREPRSSATIIADPDYGPPGKPYVRVDGTLAETYHRLAGTRVEAQEIERYFPDSKTLTAGQATKAALTAIVGPSVLHVATHGFYPRAAAALTSPRANDRDHQVRVVLSAACPPAAWVEFEKRFGAKIIEFYGMVDSPGLLLNDGGRIGSMGKPVGGVDFNVVGENDEPLPAGKVGELVFRHPKGQLTHYHKLPDATASAYRGGWFHSGDLAKVDEQGFFYFCGRKKASIRRRGENISAWEIETVVNQHPSVLESAAYAVPSELGEDEVKVAVVLKPGVKKLAPEKLIEFCRDRMAYYAVPRFIEFVDDLPQTGTQRIQYEALKQRGIGNSWDREQTGLKVARV